MADHARAMYEFCGAFYAQLRAAGVTDVVVSPGYRSGPLTVCADRAGMRLWVQLDERSAGFFGLGLARGSRRTVALISTSGTAAANYLPAVIEASRSSVPLVVTTADRSPELRGWGSNQTIDQGYLYGTNTRWFAELPVASEAAPEVAARLAARAAAIAAGPPPGPVHLNFPLRPPLRPDDGVPTSFRAEATIATHVTPEPAPAAVDALVAAIDDHERGIILAGALNPGSIEVEDVLDVAARAGWPILAEPTSQLRVDLPSESAAVISTADFLVQDAAFAATHRPEAVVLVGAAPPTRASRSWLAEGASRVFVLGDGPEWTDESFTFTDAIRFDAGAVFAAVKGRVEAHDERAAWAASWLASDAAAYGALRSALEDSPMFEGHIVTALAAALPEAVPLYVGNSMAVRDVNLYWPRHNRQIDIFSNRGASGIDGMVSSALGVAAASGSPVVLLLGDLSLLHDLSGVLAAVRLGLPLVTVVVDNDGGGIFSFLPIAEQGDEVRFREVFHTPHGADMSALLSGLGVAHAAVDTPEELLDEVGAGLARSGPTVIEVALDAAESVARHREVDAAVRRAVTAAL